VISSSSHRLLQCLVVGSQLTRGGGECRLELFAEVLAVNHFVRRALRQLAEGPLGHHSADERMSGSPWNFGGDPHGLTITP